MHRSFTEQRLLGALIVCAGLMPLCPPQITAQWPFPPPTTRDAQRNALNAVKAQINWLQNATRTASSYGAQGVGNVWGTYQDLLQSYNAFKATLNPQQLAQGANALAELDAGLDIIQEAFSNYQQDVAAGQLASHALGNMCQVLREASNLWWQELRNTCSRLRVGWG